MNKKDLVIVALATFCLTSTLFMILPSRSADRDPWADVTGPDDVLDDIVNMRDIQYEILRFNQNVSDMTRNVNVTNWPTWLVNQSATLVKEMPLYRIYNFNITSTSYTTAINVTPPIGKTWYVSEIKLKTLTGDGMITLKTKGVTQFSDIYQGMINSYFDTMKFPAIIKFTDTESIIVEAKVFDGYPYMSGLFLVIGWEE